MVLSVKRSEGICLAHTDVVIGGNSSPSSLWLSLLWFLLFTTKSKLGVEAGLRKGCSTSGSALVGSHGRLRALLTTVVSSGDASHAH